MSVQREYFGSTPQGDASLFTITTKRLIAKVTDYGAVLVSLYTPDKEGHMDDIVLGFDSLERYMDNPYCYGASVAPSANRIAGACFEIDGAKYSIPANEGINNLHSDKLFYKRLFQAEAGHNSVAFTLQLPDGDAGFPGNRTFVITYTLTEEELRIDYHIESDKKTILNPTNHSYFNLSGEGSGDILDEYLQMNCAAYTPVDDGLIPTGEISDVKGTAYDFTTGKVIGRDLARSEEEAARGIPAGYDNNFVIDGYKGDGSLLKAAELWDPHSGRVMEVLTTLPGMQFFTANGMVVENGKGGRTYTSSAGLALETQFFPDSVHHANFPNTIFGEGRNYESTTIYRFGPCKNT